MAFYVKLKKIAETTGAATYSFSADQRGFGQVELDKQGGTVRVVRPAPGDEAGNASGRAAAKLRMEWRRGSIPDVTEWAS